MTCLLWGGVLFFPWPIESERNIRGLSASTHVFLSHHASHPRTLRKTNRDWRGGSAAKALALQARGPSSNPRNHVSGWHGGRWL